MFITIFLVFGLFKMYTNTTSVNNIYDVGTRMMYYKLKNNKK